MSDRRIIRVLSALLLFSYIGAVLFCCFWKFNNLPSLELTILGIPKDKIVHFLMFLPFPFLMFINFGLKLKGWGKLALFILSVVLLGLSGAALTEWGQGMTGYRSPDPMDFLADSAGLFAGTALVAAAYCAMKR